MGSDDIDRRDFMLLVGSLAPAGALLDAQPAQTKAGFESRHFQISILGRPGCLWSYRLKAAGKEYRFAPPTFNVDKARISGALKNIRPTRPPKRLNNGAMEYRYEGTFAARPSLSLVMVFQAAEASPIVRFSYILKSSQAHALTKPSGRDDLTYLGFEVDNPNQTREIRLANFSQLSHSYLMEEVAIGRRSFEDGASAMGPILVSSDGRASMLVAYEHGSQVPDAYLEYRLRPDASVRLQAVKGNYLAGQVVDAARPYQTVWFEAGAVRGDEDRLAAAFRDFVLNWMSESLGTRKPHICYNTWNYQERNKWWNGKQYLASMNPERILKEVDVAHRMGIEIYVLDTGWYGKTGEWSVSRERFPDGLKRVKEKLDRYGMRLGLWFGPAAAAISSRALAEHRDCVMSRHGVERKLGRVWGTEASYQMCLVSRYSDAFAERLIELSKEIGVTYFKWDGIGQYGCDSARHWHGNESNTPAERSDSYAFQLIRQMESMARRIAAACPGAIVDFDVTEARRAVGLGFLASGRFFLMNNGPYYQSYNIPYDRKRQNSNVFFHPGPARTWICRTPLGFDKWIPSILFMTHYYPDDPISQQEISMASLILGQNGIWGDLPGVSDAGVAYIGDTLARYKQVREDMAASDPLRQGQVSGSPEIHEKINAKTGRGAVVLFATAKGRYSYVTTRRVASKHWAGAGVRVRRDGQGRAVLDFNLHKPGSKIVFFGVE